MIGVSAVTTKEIKIPQMATQIFVITRNIITRIQIYLRLQMSETIERKLAGHIREKEGVKVITEESFDKNANVKKL